ncbi:MAG: extracellular solute-binding protein [Phycisphaerales bacterium]|nr:extracellular solute-binding protein [Phycisphaerales bacterium]
MLILILGCDGTESKTLTVYVSADEYIAREVIRAFTNETDIKVSWVGDTEASKTTGLITRLRREVGNPVADVFWSSENIGTIQLASEGVFAPYSSQVTEAWSTQYKDATDLWYAFSPRARVIAYDPKVTSKNELPEYWWQYADAAMADPRFGTTGTHLAVMAADKGRFYRFVKELSKTPLLAGNSATVQSVIDGVAKYAMTDSDDVHAAIAQGASVAAFMPRHFEGEGGGTLLIPNTVAVIASCDHPELAGLFVDFMLSEKVATILAESNSKNIPLQKNVASRFPELKVEDPLVVDFVAAAARRRDAIQQVMQHMREPSAR